MGVVYAFDFDAVFFAEAGVVFGLPLDEEVAPDAGDVVGEVREVAKSDPRVATYPGLHVGLPNGLAPNPQVRDGVVVWDEYFIAGTGVGKRIQQYVIATGLTSSVAQVDDARFEELSRPVEEVPAGGSPFAFRTAGAWH